jgi:hypothetical protein
MPTKSGSIVYMEDGSNAYQVYSANSPDSNSMAPMDKQAQAKVQIENNTTALGASATYTGASFDTMADGVNYTWLTGLVQSNVGGTLNVQQSVDGTNWFNLNAITVNAATNTPIDVKILLRYVRFNYVNGGTAQTNFNLFGFVTFL